MEFIILNEDKFNELKGLQSAYKVEIGEDAPNEENFESLYKAIMHNNITFYGCICDEKLVACCSICKTYSTFNYDVGGVLEDFYIMPDYRHKGIARKLVRYAYNASGVTSLTVGAADCDVEMYKALGFTIGIGNLLAFA